MDGSSRAGAILEVVLNFYTRMRSPGCSGRGPGASHKARVGIPTSENVASHQLADEKRLSSSRLEYWIFNNGRADEDIE